MRTHILMQAIGGLVLGAILVALFSPRGGSFWGNSFFGLPYNKALLLVPLFATVSAALATLLVLRTPSHRTRSPIWRGLRIGSLAFLFYFAFHVAAHATFNDIVVSIAFAGLLAVFGGIFFMPICCLVAVAIEFATRRHAAP
jgi:hypothetical protein